MEKTAIAHKIVELCKGGEIAMMWYDWVWVLIVGLLWIEHYMGWKLRIMQKEETQ